MPATDVIAQTGSDKLDAILVWLSNENEVLRSVALRALIHSDLSSDTVRTHLLDALLDPDPDIRSDAMDALFEHARPEDVDTICTSLEGDPVREVKIAATRILGRLGGDRARRFLRDLALSRCEDTIAWEDELSDWEDWLDVQIAAIGALGDLSATDCIEDLFDARDDEMAQTLDGPVFDALARMGVEGVTWLLATMQTEKGLGRKRAADAVAKADPETLSMHRDILLEADDPQLRKLAVERVSLDDSVLRSLATDDPSPDVRCSALQRTGDTDLMLQALGDPAERVKVTAIEGLQPDLDAKVQETLGDNLMAWAKTAGPVLATAAVTHLALYAPDRAQALLHSVALDPDRALETRVAAVRALGQIVPAGATPEFADLLASPASQVRMAALTVLRARVDTVDSDASELVVAALAGQLLTSEQATLTHEADSGADLAVPKGEGAGRNNIRITREGDIVSADAPNTNSDSTLDAILNPIREPETQAEDTPEEAPAKRMKRRAVEGPDAVAEALSIETVRAMAGCSEPKIKAALVARCQDDDDALRRTIWLGLRTQSLDDDLRTASLRALEDPDPVVRQSAYALVLKGANDPSVIAQALNDQDALIRAEAVGSLEPSAACEHIADPATAVRNASLAKVLEGDAACARSASERLLAAERSDTLSELLLASEVAHGMALNHLCDPDLAGRKAFVILTALASRKPAA